MGDLLLGEDISVSCAEEFSYAFSFVQREGAKSALQRPAGREERERGDFSSAALRREERFLAKISRCSTFL